MANNVGKGIIFLIGQDCSSYHFKDLKYASSNEDLQGIYSSIQGITGTGLFVIGGFDQVASLLSHSDLTLAHLVDVNLTAVEYARLRLALTQISDTRFEYVRRLISRRVTGDFEDILSLKRYIDSKDKRFDHELAEETATLLRSNFGISEKLLEETILTQRFEWGLSRGNEGDFIADRRLWSFLEINEDNWLSSDVYFEKVKTMYQNGKIKFSHFDLANSTVSLNLFGNLSLIYLSNIHDWLKVELNHLISHLCLNGLETDENTIIISTSTKEEGRGKITTRNL